MSEPAPAEAVEIAVNLDDIAPEVVGHALTTLIDEGALDAWVAPITMKKNRPAVCLSVLCRARDRDRLSRRVIELTGSFGVRFRLWDRLVLRRRHETVDTTLGPMRLKVGLLEGRPVTAKPEFEDAVAMAGRLGLTVRQILDVGRAAAQSWLDRHDGRSDEGGGAGENEGGNG